MGLCQECCQLYALACPVQSLAKSLESRTIAESDRLRIQPTAQNCGSFLSSENIDVELYTGNPSSLKHCIVQFLVSLCSWRLLFSFGNAVFKVARKRNLRINIIKHACAVQALMGNVPQSDAKFFTCLHGWRCTLDIFHGFLLNVLVFPTYSLFEKYWSHCTTEAHPCVPVESLSLCSCKNLEGGCCSLQCVSK